MKLHALLIVAMLAAFAFTACGTTPNERYNLAAHGFNAFSASVTGYDLVKPIPAPLKARIEKDEDVVVQRMVEANAWLDANPQLANLPGAPFPPLDPLNIAIDVLRKDLRGVVGIRLIPTRPVGDTPTTQPQ